MTNTDLHPLTSLLTQAYCTKENENKIVDTTLLIAMDKIIRQFLTERSEWLKGFLASYSNDYVDQAFCLSPSSKPDYYYGRYMAEVDPEVTCWHCKRTFLCDCMDATCRLCGAPFDKTRCKEFNFSPSSKEEKKCRTCGQEWSNHEPDACLGEAKEEKKECIPCVCNNCGTVLTPTPTVEIPKLNREAFNRAPSWSQTVDLANLAEKIITVLNAFEKRLKELEEKR